MCSHLPCTTYLFFLLLPLLIVYPSGDYQNPRGHTNIFFIINQTEKKNGNQLQFFAIPSVQLFINDSLTSSKRAFSKCVTSLRSFLQCQYCLLLLACKYSLLGFDTIVRMSYFMQWTDYILHDKAFYCFSISHSSYAALTLHGLKTF